MIPFSGGQHGFASGLWCSMRRHCRTYRSELALRLSQISIHISDTILRMNVANPVDGKVLHGFDGARLIGSSRPADVDVRLPNKLRF